MGKKKGVASGRGSAQAGLVAIDPMVVRFTHSRIRPQFSCGRRVEDTLEDLCSGKITVADLPPITLLSSNPSTLGPPYFSLNNRRLFVMKELRRRGVIEEVMARIKPPADSKRDHERYTVEKCSLTAKLMGVKEAKEHKETDENAGQEEAVETTTKSRPAKFPMDWKKTQGDVTVYGIDANSLLPKKWVRDPVISVFFDFLEAKSKKGVKSVQPPVSLLVQHSQSPVLPDGHFKGAELILVAINNSSSPECAVSGSHWSLLTYDVAGRTWVTYDSFSGGNDKLATSLAQLLHPLMPSDTPFAITSATTTQQSNTSDCGVHLMINAAQCAGVDCPAEPSEMRGHLLDLLWELE